MRRDRWLLTEFVLSCLSAFSLIRRLELSEQEMVDEAKEAVDRLFRVYGWFELRE